MRYLYYCNSTYQLLNILNLHWHRQNAAFESIDDYHGDLMIQNSFEGAEQIARIIESESAFDSVLLVNKAYNSGVFHIIERAEQVVACHRTPRTFTQSVLSSGRSEEASCRERV